MHEPRLRPGELLFAAILLGILADLLLWGARWGLAFTLWISVLTGVLAFLFVRSPSSSPRGWSGGAVLLLMTGLAASWRDSDVLRTLDVLAAVGCAAFLLVRTPRGTLVSVRLADLLRESIAGAIDALIGALSLIAADRALMRGEGGKGRSVLPIVRGALLAVPLLILFSALFAAADATFEYVLVTVLDIDLLSLLRHALVITTVSWCVAGVFGGRFLHSHADSLRRAVTANGPVLGLVEVSLPIGAVAFISAAFVLTQLAYLFGGAPYVIGTPQITVAEYARRGFFELVVVAALSIPLLLTAEWLLRKESARGRRIFIWLASVQLALMAIIMASAFHRLFIYQEYFGLTESRLYAAAFLAWVGGVCGIFAGTVLRGSRDRFAWYSFLAGLLVGVMLHALNPDERIAEVNLSRLSEGAVLDTSYLGTLSADAVPALLESIERLPHQERAAVGALLSRWREDAEAGDWRGWNLGRSRARQVLQQGQWRD